MYCWNTHHDRHAELCHKENDKDKKQERKGKEVGTLIAEWAFTLPLTTPLLSYRDSWERPSAPYNRIPIITIRPL